MVPDRPKTPGPLSGENPWSPIGRERLAPYAENDWSTIGRELTLVEREVTNSAPQVVAGNPLTAGSSFNLDVNAGAGSYTVDVQTQGGAVNTHAGLAASSSGRLSVPEADLFPGTTNLLRLKRDACPETGYSAPVTLSFDPTVTPSSPNQVRSLAVSRSGNTITLRWSVLTDNGKKFRVYFRPNDSGTTVLLTPQALASTSRSFALSSQALASGCLEFFIRQWNLEMETADSPHTDLGPPLPGSDGRAQDPCSPGGGGGGGGGGTSPPEYAFLEHFQMRDHLGSLRVITDETGAVEEKLDFYPFGQEISFGTLGKESERKYTGHQRDGRTGLDYMMARYKAPWMGTFQSPDLIDDVALDVPWSWNKYAYVRGNPIAFHDPYGLESVDQATCERNGGTWTDIGCIFITDLIEETGAHAFSDLIGEDHDRVDQFLASNGAWRMAWLWWHGLDWHPPVRPGRLRVLEVDIGPVQYCVAEDSMGNVYESIGAGPGVLPAGAQIYELVSTNPAVPPEALFTGVSLNVNAALGVGFGWTFSHAGFALPNVGNTAGYGLSGGAALSIGWKSSLGKDPLADVKLPPRSSACGGGSGGAD